MPTGPGGTPAPTGFPTASPTAPIAISVGLQDELRLALSLLRGRRRRKLETGRCYEGFLGKHPAVVYQTGMGPNNARQANLLYLDVLKPRAVLAVGFAGGAAAGLGPGAVVVAEPLFDPPRPSGEGPREFIPDAALLEAARKVGAPRTPPAVFGKLAGVKSPLGSPAEKKHYFEKYGAVAVDMESLGVAKAANVRDVPFLGIRAIVDPCDAPLPAEFGRFLSPEGNTRIGSVLWSVLRKPALLASIAEIGRCARMAREGLRAFLAAYFDLL